MYMYVRTYLQDFYPGREEVFKKKGGGRRFLKANYPDAVKTYVGNLRVIRSWFAAYKTNPDLYSYMNTDYKMNTEVKEKCRAYMKTKMGELSPLHFKCPDTGSAHEMPFSEDHVFDLIKNRKQEWRKSVSRSNLGMYHPNCNP